MDRRLGGALLLLVVALALVVVPSAGGIRVAGEPTAAALPAPPKVGDCVTASVVATSVVAGEWQPSPIDGPLAGPPGPTTAALFGPCDPTVDMAEVVAVSTIVGTTFGKLHIAAPDGQGCRGDALRYAGLVSRDSIYTLPDAPGDEPIAWDFSIDVGTRWMIPSRALWSAGATWAACVVTPPVGKGHRGSIRRAFAGPLPSGLGTCWVSDHLSAGVRYVDCAAAHRSELIATGSLIGPSMINFDEVVQSCGHISARALGRADPTDGGSLKLVISPDVSMWNRANRRSSSAVCFLASASDRLIIGSLIGVGDRPISWTG